MAGVWEVPGALSHPLSATVITSEGAWQESTLPTCLMGGWMDDW